MKDLNYDFILFFSKFIKCISGNFSIFFGWFICRKIIKYINKNFMSFFPILIYFTPINCLIFIVISLQKLAESLGINFVPSLLFFIFGIFNEMWYTYKNAWNYMDNSVIYYKVTTLILFWNWDDYKLDFSESIYFCFALPLLLGLNFWGYLPKSVNLSVLCSNWQTLNINFLAF